jgi:formate-dependent nitrite reductase membrane component NrfD
MTTEKQQSWGWQVIADVFAGGIGAGVFVVSFFMEQVYGTSQLTNVGILLGPLLVLVGIFFLLIEVGQPKNAVRAFLNIRTSWMSRGVILLPVFIGLSLLYALIPLVSPNFKTSAFSLVLGLLAVLIALLVALYYGFLFSQARGIALWNNPLLPMLYFVSALAGGTGLLMVLSPFLNAATGLTGALKVIGLAFVCLVLVSIWLMVGIQSSHTYRESLRSLLSPSFIVVTLGLGHIVPLVVLILSLFVRGAATSVLLFIAGAFSLVGALHLRTAITQAGHHYTMRVSL